MEGPFYRFGLNGKKYYYVRTIARAGSKHEHKPQLSTESGGVIQDLRCD